MKVLRLGSTQDPQPVDTTAQTVGSSAELTETRRTNRLYEAILSTTPDLVYVFDLDHRFVYANGALLAMWGKTWDEAIGKTCLELGYEPWHAAMHDAEIDEVIGKKHAVRGEVPFDGTNGKRIYDYIFVPVFDADGGVEAVAGTTRDVTDRKRGEEQRALLADELRHRVKNTLAVVQVIARQSFNSRGAEFDAFSARLIALSNGLDILTQKNWSSASIHSLTKSVLAAHHPADGHRINLSGPDLLLRPSSVVALSLALNELATNAVKYGALSNAEGQVSVTWTTDGNQFHWTWCETGGPPVTRPATKGFGSKLITSNLATALSSTVDIQYHPSGLVCEVNAELAGITEAGAT